jgi:hypothetical protein
MHRISQGSAKSLPRKYEVICQNLNVLQTKKNKKINFEGDK